MICKECETGHNWPFRGRGYKYDTGHWYRKNFAYPEDYALTCKLTPWLKITIFACPRALPWNTTPHFVILLGDGQTVDQKTRIELQGCDVNEAKHRALEAVKTAVAKVNDIATMMLADLPRALPPDASPALKRLEKAVAHAEAVLAGTKR